jgi:hypothetical protein
LDDLAAAFGTSPEKNYMTVRGRMPQAYQTLATMNTFTKNMFEAQEQMMLDQRAKLITQRTTGKWDQDKQVQLDKVETQLANSSKKFYDLLDAMKGEGRGEGFTLKPGDIRFDEGGTPIAFGGEKKEKFPTNETGLIDLALSGGPEAERAKNILEVSFDRKAKLAGIQAEQRGVGFSRTRIAKVWDSVNNVPVFTSLFEVSKMNKEEPGRYIPLEGAAGFQALLGSYKNVRKQYDMTQQAVNQAQYLGKALYDTSNNFKRFGYPAPNRVAVWASTQLGDKETQEAVGRFKVALMAFSREYMRVVTGGARSVAELSIGAQDTADDVLARFDTWDVLNAKVDQAFIEMNYVSKSFQDQMNNIQNELGPSGVVGLTGGSGFQPPAKSPIEKPPTQKDIGSMSDEEILKALEE